MSLYKLPPCIFAFYLNDLLCIVNVNVNTNFYEQFHVAPLPNKPDDQYHPSLYWVHCPYVRGGVLLQFYQSDHP